MVAALPPSDPGGCPFTAGHPKPAVRGEIQPAAIVVGGPAKVFVGDPGPAGICVGPVAVRIGSPIRLLSDGGLPDIAVVIGVDPVAIGAECVEEEIDGDIDLRVRRRHRHGPSRRPRRCPHRSRGRTRPPWPPPFSTGTLTRPRPPHSRAPRRYDRRHSPKNCPLLHRHP